MEELKKKIQDVLSALQPSLLEEVLQHLTDRLGVETIGDLEYVEPSDLPMLKSIQVRKLIQSWRTETTNSQTVQLISNQHEKTEIEITATPSSTSDLNVASPQLQANRNAIWADEYDVPWMKFSQRDIMSFAQRGLRPKPSARREMIRILVDDIGKISMKPGKKALTSIAKKLVRAYPRSFQDEIEGEIIGTGYDSILRQMQARFENINRKKAEFSVKRKQDESGECEEVVMEGASSHRKGLCDEYGCKDYMPMHYPDGESEDTQREKKNTLKDKYSLGDSNQIEDLMMSTYISQRKDILNKNATICSLLVEWPYLFQETGMFMHFWKLTDIKIREKIESALVSKGEQILNWMKTEQSKHIRKIQEELVEARCIVGNKTPEVPAMICAVIAYFGDKEEYVYLTVEPNTTKAEYERTLPKTPCLIGIGDSKLTASRFMVSVDGVIINDSINTFIGGLSMVFASYYNFNIKYPMEAAATLEFIQRCLVGINPDRGSKTEVKKKMKRHSQVHPKVLSLINLFADLEWIK